MNDVDVVQHLVGTDHVAGLMGGTTVAHSYRLGEDPPPGYRTGGVTGGHEHDADSGRLESPCHDVDDVLGTPYAVGGTGSQGGAMMPTVRRSSSGLRLAMELGVRSRCDRDRRASRIQGPEVPHPVSVAVWTFDSVSVAWMCRPCVLCGSMTADRRCWRNPSVIVSWPLGAKEGSARARRQSPNGAHRLLLPLDYAVHGPDVVVRIGEGLFHQLESKLVAFQVDGVTPIADAENRRGVECARPGSRHRGRRTRLHGPTPPAPSRQPWGIIGAHPDRRPDGPAVLRSTGPHDDESKRRPFRCEAGLGVTPGQEGHARPARDPGQF